jgi:hypothetical protein
MNAMHQIFQQALAPFAPKPAMGNWMHVAIIGEGNETVNCHFDMSEDGDIENLRVFGDVGEVTKYLHFTQIEELECECYDSYLIQVKEHNDDLKISRHLASRDDACVGVSA